MPPAPTAVVLRTRATPSRAYKEARGVVHMTSNTNQPPKQWITLQRRRTVRISVRTSFAPVRIFIVLDGVMRQASLAAGTQRNYDLDGTFLASDVDFGSIKVLVQQGVCKPKLVLNVLYTDLAGWQTRGFPVPTPYMSFHSVHQTKCKTPTNVVQRFDWFKI